MNFKLIKFDTHTKKPQFFIKLPDLNQNHKSSFKKKIVKNLLNCSYYWIFFNYEN